MIKNQEIDVDIIGIGSEGQGVARYDNFVVFVPFALPGERVRVHIINVKKSYAVGKIISLIKKSPYRIEPLCPYFYKCGGCKLEHTLYDNALNIKRTIVVDALTKIGGFENVNVKNVVKSDKIYNYRDKSAFPICLDDNGNAHISMFKSLSHNPIFINKCLITKEDVNKILPVLERFLNEQNPSIKKGLRFLVLRLIKSKILITFVADKQVQNYEKLYSLLKEVFSGDIGLYYCKKDIDNNVILEGELKWLIGIKEIDAEIMGIKVKISPMSFFQVNEDIMQKIYNKVLDYFSKNDTIVDAYSGAGLMSSIVAKKSKKVYAIEIVKEATNDAERLKEANSISNLTNINGDVKEVLPSLVNDLDSGFSLILDPPRKGVDKEVLETIIKSSPDKIAYVSCSPQSLARDLKVLNEAGYTLIDVQPFDMFPQTHHVEVVALLKSSKN